MSWINGYQVWLSESQSLKNAQLVADHLTGEGWTPESISALLGNMRHESSVNPNMYEYGYGWGANRGFGLVQWTPRSKYWDWALANGFSESELRDGNAQLARIDYEVDNNIQWISTPNYPLSFSQFRSATTDNYSIDYLTRAFTWNYERPNLQAGENSMPDRIAFAKKCLNQLNFSGGDGGGSIPSGYQLAVFPMDNIDVSQGEYGDYSHTPERNEQLAMDFMARDSNNNWITEYPIYAPFDLEIIDIYHEWAQVIWRSTTKVFGVDGTKHDVITISTAHDWNYASKPIGTRIKKGELMGHTGNAGMSTGDHLHIQLFNTNYHPYPSTESQQLHLYDVFDTSNVKLWFRDGGYPWKEWDGSSDPDPDPDPNPDPDPDPEPEPEPDPWQALVSRFISDLLDELETMLTVDVHKQANSDYYKNSFLILQKQMENSYKIKPSFKFFDDLAEEVKKFLRDFR